MSLLNLVRAHDDREYRFHASLHDREILDGGGTRSGGGGGLRAFHERMKQRLRGGR